MNADFKSPWYLFNGHAQTIIPSIFRKIPVNYQRERLELQDGDFVDLDWQINAGNNKLVIVTHGLEGDSGRHYVTGVVDALSNFGFDGLGWNCRSCSGEMNRLPRFYHHGDASDLKAVVEYAQEKHYSEIYLVGFSMGGSLTVRYLAENKDILNPKVKSAVVASVPLDLLSSVKELDKAGKRFYQTRFLKKLYKKITTKSKMYPNHAIIYPDNYWQRIKNFADFDNAFTAPLHGYQNATDFYTRASVKPLLDNITVPLTIVQALNDPFLTAECLEINAFKDNLNLEFCLTKTGGHVGFLQKGKNQTFVEELAIKKFTNK
jgi:uncharacterized protein